MNKITTLKNEAGEWIDGVECLKSWGMSYFKALYSTDSNYSTFPLSDYFPKLLRGDYMDISREISQEEIRAAIFDMESWKAPDSNGIPAKFFQQSWNIIAESVMT
ncbi:hypothetical protein Ahy_B05g078966 [Arachis hypogaea]|uniref:Uncharacterized protein n=1 Tax=Arachis hypogaea TaxID=3818 RepID=A0A444Z8N8_ARAHY|nr:hypothetical protein Ahy_B05g078966 [Arachis hypogaea]